MALTLQELSLERDLTGFKRPGTADFGRTQNLMDSLVAGYSESLTDSLYRVAALEYVRFADKQRGIDPLDEEEFKKYYSLGGALQYTEQTPTEALLQARWKMMERIREFRLQDTGGRSMIPTFLAGLVGNMASPVDFAVTALAGHLGAALKLGSAAKAGIVSSSLARNVTRSVYGGARAATLESLWNTPIVYVAQQRAQSNYGLYDATLDIVGAPILGGVVGGLSGFGRGLRSSRKVYKTYRKLTETLYHDLEFTPFEGNIYEDVPMASGFRTQQRRVELVPEDSETPPEPARYEQTELNFGPEVPSAQAVRNPESVQAETSVVLDALIRGEADVTVVEAVQKSDPNLIDYAVNDPQKPSRQQAREEAPPEEPAPKKPPEEPAQQTPPEKKYAPKDYVERLQGVMQSMFGVELRINPDLEVAGRMRINRATGKADVIEIQGKASASEITLAAFHELGHSLRVRDVRAFARLTRALSEVGSARTVTVDNRKLSFFEFAMEEVKRSYGDRWNTLSKARQVDEAVAHALGLAATDPRFWKRLQQRDLNVFNKLRDFLVSLFKTIQEALTGREFHENWEPTITAIADAVSNANPTRTHIHPIWRNKTSRERYDRGVIDKTELEKEELKHGQKVMRRLLRSFGELLYDDTDSRAMPKGLEQVDSWGETLQEQGLRTIGKEERWEVIRSTRIRSKKGRETRTSVRNRLRQTLARTTASWVSTRTERGDSPFLSGWAEVPFKQPKIDYSTDLPPRPFTQDDTLVTQEKGGVVHAVPTGKTATEQIKNFFRAEAYTWDNTAKRYVRIEDLDSKAPVDLVRVYRLNPVVFDRFEIQSNEQVRLDTSKYRDPNRGRLRVEQDSEDGTYEINEVFENSQGHVVVKDARKLSVYSLLPDEVYLEKLRNEDRWDEFFAMRRELMGRDSSQVEVARQIYQFVTGKEVPTRDQMGTLAKKAVDAGERLQTALDEVSRIEANLEAKGKTKTLTNQLKRAKKRAERYGKVADRKWAAFRAARDETRRFEEVSGYINTRDKANFEFQRKRMSKYAARRLDWALTGMRSYLIKRYSRGSDPDKDAIISKIPDLQDHELIGWMASVTEADNWVRLHKMMLDNLPDNGTREKYRKLRAALKSVVGSIVENNNDHPARMNELIEHSKIRAWMRAELTKENPNPDLIRAILMHGRPTPEQMRHDPIYSLLAPIKKGDTKGKKHFGNDPKGDVSDAQIQTMVTDEKILEALNRMRNRINPLKDTPISPAQTNAAIEAFVNRLDPDVLEAVAMRRGLGNRGEHKNLPDAFFDVLRSRLLWLSRRNDYRTAVDPLVKEMERFLITLRSSKNTYKQQVWAGEYADNAVEPALQILKEQGSGRINEIGGETGSVKAAMRIIRTLRIKMQKDLEAMRAKDPATTKILQEKLEKHFDTLTRLEEELSEKGIPESEFTTLVKDADRRSLVSSAMLVMARKRRGDFVQQAASKLTDAMERLGNQEYVDDFGDPRASRSEKYATDPVAKLGVSDKIDDRGVMLEESYDSFDKLEAQMLGLFHDEVWDRIMNQRPEDLAEGTTSRDYIGDQMLRGEDPVDNRFDPDYYPEQEEVESLMDPLEDESLDTFLNIRDAEESDRIMNYDPNVEDDLMQGLDLPSTDTTRGRMARGARRVSSGAKRVARSRVIRQVRKQAGKLKEYNAEKIRVDDSIYTRIMDQVTKMISNAEGQDTPVERWTSAIKNQDEDVRKVLEATYRDKKETGDDGSTRMVSAEEQVNQAVQDIPADARDFVRRILKRRLALERQRESVKSLYREGAFVTWARFKELAESDRALSNLDDERLREVFLEMRRFLNEAEGREEKINSWYREQIARLETRELVQRIRENEWRTKIKSQENPYAWMKNKLQGLFTRKGKQTDFDIPSLKNANEAQDMRPILAVLYKYEGLLDDFRNNRITKGLTEYLMSDRKAEVPQRIKELGDAIYAVQRTQVEQMNQSGAHIRWLSGYLFRQVYHKTRTYRGSYEQWKKDFEEAIDWESTEKALGGMLYDPQTRKMLPFDRDVYMERVWTYMRGEEWKNPAPDEELGGNIAEQVSKHRHIYFKPEKFYDWNEQYGSGDLAQSLIASILRKSDQRTILDQFGPDYKKTWKAIRSEVGPRNHDAWIDKLFRQVTGEMDHGINQRLEDYGRMTRMASNIIYLGGAGLSALNDIPNILSTLQYEGIKMHFLDARFRKALSDAFWRNYSRKQGSHFYFRAHGAGLDAITGAVARRLTGENLGYGAMAQWNDKMFHWNQLATLTTIFQESLMDLVTRGLATGEIRADRLARYGITEAEYARIRETAREVPGLEGKRVDLDALDEPLQLKLRAYMDNIMRHGVLEPDTGTQVITRMGLQSGTFTGEAARIALQYTTFPLAMTRKTWSRLLFGYGEKEFVNLMGMPVNRQYLHIASFAASMFAVGYLITVIKDLLNGREPINPFSPNADNLLRVVDQSGAGGVISLALNGITSNDPLRSSIAPIPGSIGELISEGNMARFASNNFPFSTYPGVGEAAKMFFAVVAGDALIDMEKYQLARLQAIEHYTGQSSIYKGLLDDD